MRTLPGQHLRERDYADMERQVNAAFYALLYSPILDILEEYSAQVRPGELKNARPTPLAAALRSGRVQYTAGVFSGSFDRAISAELRKLGAAFDKRSGVYRIDQSKAPGWVKAEAGLYQTTAREANRAVKAKLEEVLAGLDEAVVRRSLDAEKMVSEVDSGFVKSTRAISVSPEVSFAGREEIAREYTANMKLWIKKFTAEQIVELRAIVEGNAEEGYRFDKLIGGIKNRYEVSRSKAKFLARQETGLYMSQHRRQRFADVGIMRYVWETSGSNRVRDGKDGHGNHKILNGKVFSYKDKAPAQFMSSGKPCNPGEDYNCECIDRPILDAAEAARA